MSDHQKEAFAERLKRIEKNPGNGRLVEPGAADALPEKGKRRKPQGKRVAPAKKRYKKPRIGLSWLVGLIAGFVVFVIWLGVYDPVSTPSNWSLASLPVPPRDIAIWVGGVLFIGLVSLQRFDLRHLFVMVIGMVMGAAVVGGVAGAAPDLGRSLTNETFVNQMQAIFARFSEE